MKIVNLLLLPLVFSSGHKAPKLTKGFLTKARAAKINAELIHEFMESAHDGGHGGGGRPKRVCRRMLKKLKRQVDRKMAVYATLKTIFEDITSGELRD